MSRAVRWRDLGEIVGWIAGGLLLGFLLLEAIARALWEDEWQDPARGDALRAQGLPVFETIIELAQESSRGVHRNVLHRTNRLGVRGPEYTPKPLDGVLRILVTGDSITMGAGVPEEDRYTNQLARRLGAGFEVVNVGLSGLNASGAIERLVVLSRSYDARLFVYGFTLNDIEGDAYRARRAAPKDFARDYWGIVDRVERQPFFFRRFLLAWQFERNRPSGGDAEVVENYLENPAAWAAFEAGLDRFAELSQRQGPCGHVLIHSHLGQLDDAHPYLSVYDRVEAAAARRGLRVTQSFPDFAALESTNARALWVSLFDPHPNRKAHATLAKALHDGLAAQLEACRAPEAGASSGTLDRGRRPQARRIDGD